MQGSKSVGIFADVLLLRPQLAEARLSSLRNGSLRDQTAQYKLAGKIEPMRGKRVHDIAPDPHFEAIQACRRLWAALPGDKRHEGDRGFGFATTRHEISLRPDQLQ